MSQENHSQSHHEQQNAYQQFQNKALKNPLMEMFEMWQHNPMGKMAKESVDNFSMNKMPSMDMSSYLHSQRSAMAKVQEASQVAIQCLQHCASIQTKAVQDFSECSMEFGKEIANSASSSNPVDHQQSRVNNALKHTVETSMHFMRDYLKTINHATLEAFDLLSQATSESLNENIHKKDMVVKDILKKKVA